MASTEASLAAEARPEVRLLLATGGGEDQDDVIVRAASGPIDWERFLMFVRRERAASVVWPRLRRLCQDNIPATVRKWLQREALLGDVRMTRLSARLDETLNALTTAGIPVVLLKGAALGRTIYRSLPRRPMLDLDMLVPDQQVRSARNAVLATGWEPGPYEELGETFYRDHCHLPPFYDQAGGDFSLELHWDLLFRGHPFSLDVRQLWDRSHPLPDAPLVRVLDTSDTVLHLAIHFAWGHMLKSAAWRTFRDLRALVDEGDVNWDQIVSEAHRVRAASCCYWTFSMARAWTGVPVPAWVTDSLRPPRSPRGVRVLERHFVEQWYPAGTERPHPHLEKMLWRAAIRPRWSGHGGVVPWQRDAHFKPDRAEPQPLETSRGKALRYMREFRDSLRYLRGILTRIGGPGEPVRPRRQM
ncbi:MAG: nucleotidyltransferase family protein [Gemmatimonadales bacterium]